MVPNPSRPTDRLGLDTALALFIFPMRLRVCTRAEPACINLATLRHGVPVELRFDVAGVDALAGQRA